VFFLKGKYNIHDMVREDTFSGLKDAILLLISAAKVYLLTVGLN
jgi:hypothetical protein